MAFNLNKANVKANYQPKNETGSTQASMDASVASVNAKAQVASQLELVKSLLSSQDLVTQEESTALENKYVSKAYDDLYRRGVNPVRPQILATTEFIPLSPGTEDETDQLASNIINLNYGAGSPLKVNQVMRLIDLQRIIRKTILKISSDFLEDYIGTSEEAQQEIIELFHETIKNKASALIKHRDNIDQMVDSLIQLSINASTLSPNKTQNKSKGSSFEGDKIIFKSIAAKDLKKPISGNATALGKVGFAKGFVRSGEQTAKKQVSTIKFVIRRLKLENPSYLKSLARFVIYDFIVQNSISFLNGILSLKNDIKDAISIMHTKPAQSTLPTASASNNQATSAQSSTIMGLVGDIANTSALAGQANTVTPYDINLEASLQRFLNKHSHVEDSNSNLVDSRRYSLAKVVNLDPSRDENEKFGSNFHMSLCLFGTMLENMMFLSNKTAVKDFNAGEFSIGTDKSLASALKNLKTLTLAGFPATRLGSVGSSEIPSSNKLRSLVDSEDGVTTDLANLITAICYDQVSGANINALSSENKINLIRVPTFNASEITDNPDHSAVLDYFEKAFFKINRNPVWTDLSSAGKLRTRDYDVTTDDVGVYLKNRFRAREGSITSTSGGNELSATAGSSIISGIESSIKYIPHEFSYADNMNREESFLTGADYFFQEGLATENLSFGVMLLDSRKLQSETLLIAQDLIRIYGLDFDESGKPEEEDLQGYSKNTNPMAYFLKHCSILGANIRAAADDLDDHVHLATPIISAGDYSDFGELGMVMRALFFGSIANERGHALFINPDDAKLDENIPEKASKEFAVFAQEQSKALSESIWIDIWSTKLKSLFRNGKTSDMITNSLSYSHLQSKTYKTMIDNGVNVNGIGKLINEKNAIQSHVFGSGSRNWQSDFEGDLSKKVNEDGVDNFYIDKLCIDVYTLADSLKAGFASLAAGLGSAFLGMVSFASAFGAGGLFGVIGVSALTGLAGLIVAIPLAVAASSAIAVGVIALATAAQNELNSRGKQTGVGFTGSGLTSFTLITNAALVPDELQFEANDSDSEATEKLEKVTRMGFGKEPGDLFIAKLKSNNTDNHKKYNFNINKNHGLYGGIFKTNTAQRYTAFFMFFSKIMNECLSVRYTGKDKKLYIYAYAAQYLGLADALERKPMSSDFVNVSNSGVINSASDVASDVADAYATAYVRADEMIRAVEEEIKRRRSLILEPLRFMVQNAQEMGAAVRNVNAYLGGTSNSITPGEKIAIHHLREMGYLQKGVTFLNDGTPGFLEKVYQNNFAIEFRSDDEVKNPEGISTYPFIKTESYDMRSLKLMAKVLGQKGYGLTTAEKAGAKTVLHVGIPAGLVRALQFEAYSKTEEIDYFFSNNIVMHITRVNELDPTVKYHPRSYVFNMRKYIQDFKSPSSSYRSISRPGSFLISNHIKNYNDTWDFEKILENIEITTADVKGKYYGMGMEGIKRTGHLSAREEFSTGVEESIYSDEIYRSMLINHVFDRYSKMYVESTTGFDISENNFQITRDHLYMGEVDPGRQNQYELLVDELIRRYPAANIDENLSQELFRVLETCRSSIYFSSESRADSVLGVPCFERIFSIPMCEKSFLYQPDIHIEADQIYNSGNINALPHVSMPVTYSSTIADSVGHKKFTIDSTPRARQQQYRESLHHDKTDVCSFVVEVALIKSSRRS